MPDSIAVGLLICKDKNLCLTLSEVADTIKGLSLEIGENIEGACSQVEAETVSLIIVHLDEGTRIAGITRLLQTIALTDRLVPMIVVGEQQRAEQFLALLRLGVAECLARPLDLGRLAYLIDVLTIEARHGLRHAKDHEPSMPDEIHSLPGEELFLYSKATRMGQLIEQVQRLAQRDTTILLGGETGTGKSRLAREIHRLSNRADRPFLTVNCGALSASLIESEMFGHARGAFTGADAEHVGKFSEAGRGTLFLDEVDSLPLPLQAKLLRAVEERVFEPVGSNKTQKMQARLIAACNRPLEEEVAAGRFRADLYYRLNVVAFELPPLRERIDVIPALARMFLDEFAANGDHKFLGFSTTALQALKTYSWPGNLRELRNVMERAAALCSGPIIGLDDLPRVFDRSQDRFAPSEPTPQPSKESPARNNSSSPTPTPLRNPVSSTLNGSRDHAERETILHALRKHGNNRLRAAAELGISRWTLYKKLHKHNLMEFIV